MTASWRKFGIEMEIPRKQKSISTERLASARQGLSYSFATKLFFTGKVFDKIYALIFARTPPAHVPKSPNQKIIALAHFYPGSL